MAEQSNRTNRHNPIAPIRAATVKGAVDSAGCVLRNYDLAIDHKGQAHAMNSAHRPLLTLTLFGLACTAYGQNIFSIAGVPYGHRKAVDGQPALNAPLNFVYGLLFDRVTGRLLFHDQTLVERVESDGSLLALVGRGEPQDATAADGTLASNLQINVLRGMAQDAAGNLYLADAGAGLVFRVAGDGRVSIFAGGGTRSGPAERRRPGHRGATRVAARNGVRFEGQPGHRRNSLRLHPAGLPGWNHLNRLHAVRLARDRRWERWKAWASTRKTISTSRNGLAIPFCKIGANGTATTIAGTGAAGFSGDGGPAAAAQLYGPSAVAIASDGTIYIADSGNNRVRKIALDGTISTVAGTRPQHRKHSPAAHFSNLRIFR